MSVKSVWLSNVSYILESEFSTSFVTQCLNDPENAGPTPLLRSSSIKHSPLLSVGSWPVISNSSSTSDSDEEEPADLQKKQNKLKFQKILNDPLLPLSFYQSGFITHYNLPYNNC